MLFCASFPVQVSKNDLVWHTCLLLLELIGVAGLLIQRHPWVETDWQPRNWRTCGYFAIKTRRNKSCASALQRFLWHCAVVSTRVTLLYSRCLCSEGEWVLLFLLLWVLILYAMPLELLSLMGPFISCFTFSSPLFVPLNSTLKKRNQVSSELSVHLNLPVWPGFICPVLVEGVKGKIEPWFAKYIHTSGH